MSGTIHELREFLEFHYALGFQTREDILDDAVDCFCEEDGYPGDNALSSLLDEVAAVHERMQASWSSRTDTDRLVRAFETLNRKGIVARHHYGVTRSDGQYSIVREARILRDRGEAPLGYVYYTWQDAENLMDGQLDLAWNTLGPKPGMTFRQVNDRANKVAKKIVDAIHSEGLAVQWDGSIGSTIHVETISWKARRDNGVPTLPSDEQIDGTPSEDESNAGPGPYTLTDNGEWLVRILYLGPPGSIAAAGSLVGLYEQMDNPDYYDRGPRPPDEIHPRHTYSFDFVASRLTPIEGRPIRFDCIAANVSPLRANWRQLAALAEGVMIVGRTEEQVTALLAQVGEQEKGCPLAVQLVGAEWNETERARVESTTGVPVSIANVEWGNPGTMQAFKPLLKQVLLRMKGSFANSDELRFRASSGSPDKASKRPWWKFW